jgi:hypothetical protein
VTLHYPGGDKHVCFIHMLQWVGVMSQYLNPPIGLFDLGGIALSGSKVYGEDAVNKSVFSVSLRLSSLIISVFGLVR